MTAYVMFLLILYIKVSHVTISFETSMQNNGSHSPSMYTLSMLRTQTRDLIRYSADVLNNRPDIAIEMVIKKITATVNSDWLDGDRNAM